MTLIRAIRKLHTYRGEGAMFTWLCTFCRREIAARLERTGKMQQVPLTEDEPDVRARLERVAADSGESADAALDREELARLVQVTLDHLPTKYGDALEWRYIQELSVDEVAGRLGVGYKAAESLLTRARESFRQGFADIHSRLSAVSPPLPPVPHKS